jgi:hypothetical protein
MLTTNFHDLDSSHAHNPPSDAEGSSSNDYAFSRLFPS